MKLKTWQKNLLSALIITVGGFLLFNVAFMLAAAVHQACSLIVRLIAGRDDFAVNLIFWQYLFILLVLGISWFIFKSKWKTLIKATYLTMPIMVLLVFVGIRFFEQPKWVPIGIGVILLGAVLLYLYKKRLPWQYFYATLFTGIVALVIVLAGIEI